MTAVDMSNSILDRHSKPFRDVHNFSEYIAKTFSKVSVVFARWPTHKLAPVIQVRNSLNIQAPQSHDLFDSSRIQCLRVSCLTKAQRVVQLCSTIRKDGPVFHSAPMGNPSSGLKEVLSVCLEVLFRRIPVIRDLLLVKVDSRPHSRKRPCRLHPSRKSFHKNLSVEINPKDRTKKERREHVNRDGCANRNGQPGVIFHRNQPSESLQVVSHAGFGNGSQP